MKLVAIFLTFAFILNSSLFFAPPTQAFSIRDIFYNSDVYNNTDGGPAGPNDLSSIYNPIIRTLFTIGGLMSFASLLYGGFMYIMGAGGSDPGKLQAGQQAITWALVGLAVLFSVYWIVQIIEILTGLRILNPIL